MKYLLTKLFKKVCKMTSKQHHTHLNQSGHKMKNEAMELKRGRDRKVCVCVYSVCVQCAHKVTITRAHKAMKQKTVDGGNYLHCRCIAIRVWGKISA